LNLRWTPRALRHLRQIDEYLSTQSPAGARRVGERIVEVVALLARFPDLGREGVLEGTIEMVVPGVSYIVVYRIDSVEVLTILGVYHGARLRPGQSAPAD
jgi:toxin ParE1/3/4